MAAKQYLLGSFSVETVSTGETSLYTVPADTKVIVKDIHLSNNSGSDKVFSLFVTRSGSDIYYESAQTIRSGGGGYHSNPNLVLIAGDILKLGTDGQIHVFVSGLTEAEPS